MVIITAAFLMWIRIACKRLTGRNDNNNSILMSVDCVQPAAQRNQLFLFWYTSVLLLWGASLRLTCNYKQISGTGIIRTLLAQVTTGVNEA